MRNKLRTAWPRPLIAGAALAGIGVICLAGAAGAGNVIDIIQKRRSFAVQEVTIERGSNLRFINADEFPHQVHATGPGMDEDSALQAPGEALDVEFPVEGTFQVTCGVHPRMHLTVIVK